MLSSLCGHNPSIGAALNDAEVRKEELSKKSPVNHTVILSPYVIDLDFLKFLRYNF